MRRFRILSVSMALVFLGGWEAGLTSPISFSDPIQLDTSHQIVSLGVIGSSFRADSGLIAISPNYILLITNSAPEWGYWYMTRLDHQGNTIDSIPKRLFPLAGQPGELNSPRAVFWYAPYFTIIGGDLFKPRIVRVTEDLEVVASSTFPTDPSYTEHSVAFDSDLWGIRSRSWWTAPASIRLWDMDAGAPVMHMDSLSGEAGANYAAAQRIIPLATPAGLRVAALDTLARKIRHFVIFRDGSTQQLDSLSFSGVTSSNLHRFRGLVWSAESSLYACYDTLSDGTSILNYYFLGSTPGSSPDMHTLTLPIAFPNRAVTTMEMSASGGLVYAVTRGSVSWGDTLQDIRVVAVDPMADSVAWSRILTGTVVPTANRFVGFVLLDTVGLYFGYKNHELLRTTFSLTDTLGPVAQTPAAFSADCHRMPWLAVVNGSPVVYAQAADKSGLSIVGWKLSDFGTLTIQDTFSFLHGKLPYRPVVVNYGDTNLFFWREDATASQPHPNSDTIVDLRVTVGAGLFPSLPEIATSNHLSYLIRNYLDEPAIVIVDTTAYIDYQTYYYADGWQNENYRRTWALHIPDNTLSTTESYPSQGTAGMTMSGDSAYRIYTSIWCSEFSPSHCRKFQYSQYMRKIVGDSLVPSQYLGGWSVIGSLPFAADVTGSVPPDSNVFGFRYDGAVAKFTPGGGFQTVAGVGAYEIPGMGDCFVQPIITPSANCVLMWGEDKNFSRIVVFDKRWQFVDAATIPFQGRVMDISNVAIDPESDRIMFAYSSFLPDSFVSARIFGQAISLDVVTSVDETDDVLPKSVALALNYPNPFNGSTQIKYSVPRSMSVQLTVYNILGQIVTTLVNSEQPAGQYQVTWMSTDSKGRPVSSGVYFYELRTEDGRLSRKMLLLK